MSEEPGTGAAQPSGDGSDRAERTSDQWFATLYAELRKLASYKLQQSPGIGLSPTTLVHELYVNLNGRSLEFADRSRFMSYAGRAMRGLVVDYARNRQALKRGGGFEITHMTGDMGAAVADDAELTRLSDALDELGLREPALAELVDLKYFCGLSLEEIAATRGVSIRTAQREWEKARLLLFRQLGEV